MLNLVFCLRRQPEISLEEFQRYWREHHGPLMRRNMAAFGAARYEQWHAMDGEEAEALNKSRGGPAGFDGVAVVWWDDLAAFRAGTGTEDGRAAGREMYQDELNFIDLENSPIFLTEARFEAVG
ncbi:MAG: EthD domain-containing protein [Alphaproteobacteria bacterium]|jgi:uncharacterized protein (TIGR02118 family)|nr:EthD domain-containing protein [Alphaproteobacteria bacterium]MDP6813811.1 EthD domain-containing protein [Alphaproteobacteria bacterium]